MKRTAWGNIREQAGCWLHERWRAELTLRFGKGSWLDLCNRKEQLEPDHVSGGRICKWNDSSRLTLCRVFPVLGSRLLAHCLQEYPIRFRWNGQTHVTSTSPVASVLLAIGGKDRLPQFVAVLASLRAQKGTEFEIIVVEQNEKATLKGDLPADVRYQWIPGPVEKFNKSRAMNTAARMAKGLNLFIHDGDYVVPDRYVSEVCERLESVEVVRPSRFIFYSNKGFVPALRDEHLFPKTTTLEAVVQNNPTPVALRSQTYWEIGGHDERFEGWGGEDTEFLDRLRTRNISEGGWMPVVHLWHPAAAKKKAGDRNQVMQNSLFRIPVDIRIEFLKEVHSYVNR